MKKAILCVFLISLLCLTGCTTKSLKCSMVNDANTELKINQDVIVDFENDKMVKMNMKTIVTLSDSYASYADELEKNLKEEYKKYEAKDGLEIKTTNKNKKVSLTFSADLNKMSDDVKKEFDIVGTGQTMSEVKTELEKQGYTCK